MMFLSEPSELSKCGLVTETGSSVLCEKTAREHVASKPIPLINLGSIRLSERHCLTDLQIARHISVVDCSC